MLLVSQGTLIPLPTSLICPHFVWKASGWLLKELSIPQSVSECLTQELLLQQSQKYPKSFS